MMDPNAKDTSWLRDALRQGATEAAKKINASPLSSKVNDTVVPVREMPKGTRLINQTPTTVTVSFKAALRFWWKVAFLMLGVCVFIPPFVATLAFAAEVAGVQRRIMEGSFASVSGGSVVLWYLIALGLCIAATVWVFRKTRPWVVLHADEQFIRVGKQLFDRRHYSGMRLGYEIETTAGMLKNDFHDLDIGLQGLRLSYGPWGEDLPYLVNKYHANEVVLWLNGKIAEAALPPVKPVAESGTRPQRFEEPGRT